MKANLMVSSWQFMLRWLLSSCVCLSKNPHMSHSTNNEYIAVFYGGVGHHIQELGEDNLAAFYKVGI